MDAFIDCSLECPHFESHTSFLQCFCLDQNNETESAVVSMAKDPYANYVVKTALEVLEESDQRDELYSELLANLAELVSAACDA